MRSQSSWASTPSIFQMSASTPAVLELDDRAAHQLGAQLGVVAVARRRRPARAGASSAGTSSSKRNLRSFSCSQSAEALQPLGLARVHLRVAVGVVAHEHLREVGVELLDVRRRSRRRTGSRTRSGRTSRPASRAAARAPWPASGCRSGAPNCSSTRHAGCVPGSSALLGRLEHALEDQVLRVGDRLGLLGRRVALDPEHLLLERPAVVEREDVELAVVAECHWSLLRSKCPTGLYPVSRRRAGYDGRVEHRFTGPSYTLGIEEELMIVDEETLDLVELDRGAARRSR